MKLKYYILFISFTLVLVVFIYILLSEIDKKAEWFLILLPAAGMFVSIFVLYRIFKDYMKIPARRNS